IAQEQQKTYEMQEAAEKQRQQLVRQTSLADIQHEVVGAEQGVQIAELHARSAVRQSQGEAESITLRATGEADAIRATGNAKAEAYKVGVDSLGAQNYALLQLMQIIGERNVRVVPDVAVTGAQGGNGLLDALMALMVKRDAAASKAVSAN
ncbi:MAG: flotillin family protein, partial [Verrucomicrobia bacterium]|nr:flotillin family protein [Verrucomicrobiota bacterium]